MLVKMLVKTIKSSKSETYHEKLSLSILHVTSPPASPVRLNGSQNLEICLELENENFENLENV